MRRATNGRDEEAGRAPSWQPLRAKPAASKRRGAGLGGTVSTEPDSVALRCRLVLRARKSEFL